MLVVGRGTARLFALGGCYRDSLIPILPPNSKAVTVQEPGS